MRYANRLLLSVVLLLAACGAATMTQPSTAEPNVPQATIEATQSTPETPEPTVEAAVATTAPPSTPVTTSTEISANASDSAAPSSIAVAQAPSQGPQYDNPISPVDLLASYYNAVNRQEYERAYGYWQEPPNDYATFAAGYADTTSVQLIVQPPARIEGAAGSLYAEIPSVLIAQHSDGSTHTFAGCIVTRKSNLHPPDIPEEDVWHLYQALISEVPNNSAIPTLLAQGCQS